MRHDSAANSKGLKARRRPPFARTRREYEWKKKKKRGRESSVLSLRAWFFSGEEKPPRSRVEGRVKRDASRDAFATKTSRKISSARGGWSVKCNDSPEYAFEILWNYGRIARRGKARIEACSWLELWLPRRVIRWNWSNLCSSRCP